MKTRSSNRLAIFDEIGTQYLRDQIEYAEMIKANHRQILHKDDFIFINSDGKPFPEKTLNDAMNKISKLMKVPVRVTPHIFRHTFTTQAIASNNVNLFQHKTVLGHADLTMTDHYTHGSIEPAKLVMKAAKKLRRID